MKTKALALLTGVALCGSLLQPGLSTHNARADALSGTLSVYDWGMLSGVASGKKLVANYEALHPGVKIKLVALAPGDPTVYQESVLASGTAPDLFVCVWTQATFPDVPKGYWLDLTSYLNGPNPYVSGSKRWIDTFVPQIIQQTQFLGKYYVLSVNAQDASFLYNKDIFQKAGISAPPTTWADLLSDSAKIKKAGFLPDLYYLGDTYGLAENSSFVSLLENQVMGKTLNKLDLNHDGTVDLRELVIGIKNHTFSPMNADYQEAWKLFKQWSQYWQPNAIANPGTVNEPQVKAMAQFLRGRVGMTYVGGVQGTAALATVKVPFKYGLFKLPQVTSASSPFATPGEKGVGVWGADNGYDWGITSAAQKDGHVKLAVDFLQYMSAPQNIVQVSVDDGVIPITKGWSPAPSHTASALYLDLIKHPTMQFSAEVALGLQWLQRRVSIQQDYITGHKTLSQAMASMQAATDTAANEAITLYHISVQ